ncbi:MAG: hydroxyacid dehydrogenase [Anaerolineales bacterium]
MNSTTNVMPDGTADFRVLICDSIAPNGVALVRQQVQVDDQTGIEAGQLSQIIDRYQGLIVRSRTKLTADLLAHAQQLKIIARAGVGLDNIDLQAAKQHGIVVINTPEATTITVAEHTLALILALIRNIPQANASIKTGNWEKRMFIGKELAGKTLGIIGVGRIGQAVANRARSFGLNLLGYDPYVSEELLDQLNIQSVQLQDLYSLSDLITVHTPLNQNTRGMINAEAIAAMKPGVLLISTSRGGIIEEQALLAGLQTGQVGGAALDVFETEPPGLNNLISHPNLIATPHIAAQTKDAQERAATQAAEEIIRFVKGLPLRWQIV